MIEQPTLTYPVLGLVVVARQLCMPVPAVLFLISAGGTAQRAGLSVPLILSVCVAGCLAGDMIWFQAGRLRGRQILRLFSGLSLNPRRTREKAMAVFAAYGLRSLLVSKFVPGLDAILPPLAGTEGVRRSHFLLFDALGSLLWSSFYVALGLSFSDRVNRILHLLTSSGRQLFLSVALPCLAWLSWRAFRVLQTVLRLKTRTMSAMLLRRELRERPGSTVVIDLLNFQDCDPSRPGIPGAIRLDPARLANHNVLTGTQDVSFVLYCSQSSQYRCARIALELRRKGVEDVWVLEGGLTCWIQAGYPVSNDFLTEDTAVEKFGFTIRDGRSRLLQSSPSAGGSPLQPGEL